MRVAYIVSAAMPGVLPRAPMAVQRGHVVLTLPSDLAALNSDRLQTRLRQFARCSAAIPRSRGELNGQCNAAESFCLHTAPSNPPSPRHEVAATTGTL